MTTPQQERRTMKKLVTVGALIGAFAPAGVSLGDTSTEMQSVATGCTKTFTVPMARRAAKTVYHTPKIKPAQLRMLRRIEQCQRQPFGQAAATAIYLDQSALRDARTKLRAARAVVNQQSPAVASYYYDYAETASGWHAYYGVANKYLAFGTRVEICYPLHSAHCVTTTVDDRGPYVYGRDFDLNENTQAALGTPGVATVGYKIER
jgi:rare lipoprotein A (peptidoglycan hydrolase)